MVTRFFHGQKPTDCGQSGINMFYAVCCNRSSKLYTNLNGGYFMRHFYFRLIFGIVWLVAAIVSVAGANISFAILYVVLGIVFLWSAYSIWKKEKDKDKGNRG